MAQRVYHGFFDSLSYPSSDALHLHEEHHVTTNIGTHNVEIADKQGLLLSNAQVAIALDEEEVYRLYTVLHTLFTHHR